jgi:hypothetical protein
MANWRPMKKSLLGLTVLLSGLFAFSASAQQMRLNQLTVDAPPAWLKESRVQRVVDRIQSKLEWDIRKIRVVFHMDEKAFLKEFGNDTASIAAFARKSDMSVHVGPAVTTQNFDEVFGHELSHVISYQKYKDAIPRWLEEGLANFVSRKTKPNYGWIASQGAIPKVRDMSHPFALKGMAGVDPALRVRMHYETSHALADLLATKCGMHDLLQLATGSQVEKYLATLCRIPDLDAALQDWVSRRAKPAPVAVPTQSH